MAIKTKPMTKAELRQYVAAYEILFQDWNRREGIGYFRFSGPFVQQVWFENLRSGAYRPVMTVAVLLAGGGATLHQFLDFPNREILPRDHDRKYESVRMAMRSEFRPEIGLPLDERAVLKLFVEQAIDRINDSSTLAALYAYFGEIEMAKEKISTVRKLASVKEELFDWEQERIGEIEALSSAIDEERHKPYLLKCLDAERSRFENA
jgi:hypothetical protein